MDNMPAGDVLALDDYTEMPVAIEENVPEVQWSGKMVQPIAEFIVGCVAAGMSDVEILDRCQVLFGGPKTVGPIKRVRESRAPQIAEKIADLSTRVAHIPIAHKAYRIMLLNDIVSQLANRMRMAIATEGATALERVTRSLLRAIDSARAECEGSGDITLVQHNVYIEQLNQLEPEELKRLASKLQAMQEEFDKTLKSSVVGEGGEVIDAEFDE